MAWYYVHNSTVLFYGRDILVVAQHFDTDRCVVTFSSRYHSDESSPKEPFGGALLEKEKTSYIAVISFSNHWWQTEEFEPAMQRIADYISETRYKKLIGYGGSMGGVGVIHSSHYIAYNRAVVFGAQYDISPDVVPWDSRWHADAKAQNISLKCGADTASRDMEIAYLYDPFTLDKRHMEIFASSCSLTAVPLGFSGHELFRTLKDIGLAGSTAKLFLLSDAPLEIIAKRVQKEFRSRRAKAHTVFKNLLSKAQETKKENLVNWARTKLTKLGQEDIGSLHLLGLSQLVEKKDPKGSEDFYDQALALDPDHPASWRGKAKSRQFAKDMTAAATYAVAALARGPNSPDLGRVLIEAAHRAQNFELLARASAHYARRVPDEVESDFFQRFAAPVQDRIAQLSNSDLDKFESALTEIRTQSPKRYAQLYQALLVRQPQSILEVGIDYRDDANIRQTIRMASVLSSTSGHGLAYHGFGFSKTIDQDVSDRKQPILKQIEGALHAEQEISGAQVTLFDVSSQSTLSAFCQRIQAHRRTVDFVFFDTAAKDSSLIEAWHSINPLLQRGAVVIFDGYCVNRSDDLQNTGCVELIATLSQDPLYEVEILPVHDPLPRASGDTKIAMVQVLVR